MESFNRFSASILSTILALTLALVLDGCSIRHEKKIRSYDRAPTKHVEYHRIPDAVPKREKYHPYGTRDYTVKKKRYRVLKSTKGYVKRGHASWYGTSFHGRYTSTQDIYDLYAMTAASPDLPLPCYAEVTNLANGKRVIVRVNDRGPFYGKRIMDLSYAAARRLGFAREGVAYVQIVAIGDHNWDYERNAPKKNAPFLKGNSYNFPNGASNSSGSVNSKSSAVRASSKVSRTDKKVGKSASKTTGKTAVVIEDKSRCLDASCSALPKSGMPIGQAANNCTQTKTLKESQHKEKTNTDTTKETHSTAADRAQNSSAKASNKTSSKPVIREARWIQVATFGRLSNARVCQTKLQRLLPDQTVFMREHANRHMYSVQLGPVNKSALPVLLDKVQSAGFKPLVIVKK